MYKLSEINIYPAKPLYKTGFFYCSEFNDIGQTGDGCGKGCDFYKPRNFKNGRCRFSNNCYEPSDDFKILKLK